MSTPRIAVLESILFVAPRPLPLKRIAELVGVTPEETDAHLQTLARAYERDGRGLRILRNRQDVQLVTAPEASDAVRRFLKEEQTGELTRAALETLTIVAYRGPVTKSELDTIRGVNCTLILRSLLIRGLIEPVAKDGDPQQRYAITADFLRHLGLTAADQLPEYATLNADKTLQDLLDAEKSHAAAGGAASDAQAPDTTIPAARP